ncbi:MAG: hypothetical protein ABJA67_13045 [Chthonomonadales bacterium]
MNKLNDLVLKQHASYTNGLGAVHSWTAHDIVTYSIVAEGAGPTDDKAESQLRVKLLNIGYDDLYVTKLFRTAVRIGQV